MNGSDLSQSLIVPIAILLVAILATSKKSSGGIWWLLVCYAGLSLALWFVSSSLDKYSLADLRWPLWATVRGVIWGAYAMAAPVLTFPLIGWWLLGATDPQLDPSPRRWLIAVVLASFILPLLYGGWTLLLELSTGVFFVAPMTHIAAVRYASAGPRKPPALLLRFADMFFLLPSLLRFDVADYPPGWVTIFHDAPTIVPTFVPHPPSYGNGGLLYDHDIYVFAFVGWAALLLFGWLARRHRHDPSDAADYSNRKPEKRTT